MATNTVFAPAKPAEIWTLAATAAPGVAVLSSTFQPGVTATGTGDYTKSEVVGPYTLSGIPAGGVGLTGKEASVYVDGTFELPVASAPTNTAQNVPVYFVTSDGSLTLTASTNKLFGKVNYPGDGYDRVVGTLPIQIGA